ncbi:MAG TPA: MraY family glycosyltransferase [Pyrinomonadaceae bacterium]|nr:MraY family glycosyltransferase [Pyrinomonadaceae bacterium]
MPRLGGVAIFLSVSIALSGLLLADNLLTQALRPQWREIAILIGCGFLVLCLGAYDDLRGAGATVKFVGLGAVTTLFYVLGGRIEGLSIPFVGAVNLPPIVGYLVTLVWVVGIANAFNLIDGMDGLAAGSALFSSLLLLIVALIQGRPVVAVVGLALSGALAGFLRYNFNPASIFLGDSGSLFVGFALAALSIQGAQKATTAVAVAIPLLAFALPVVDTGVTIARRFVNGKPIFKGDREHIHHMLLARGWSQRRVVLVLYGVSAAFGLLAMLFVNSGNGLTAVVLFVVGVAVVVAVGHLRYHEVDELRASVKRNLGGRRARASRNIQVRRACRAVAAAGTLNELFEGVLELLEPGEFVYATIQLSCERQPELNDRALAQLNGNGSMQRATLRDGRIHWSWERGDFSAEEIVGSCRFWSMRLPLGTRNGADGYVNLYREFDGDALLLDVNYLATIFQPAMTQATDRIFANCARQASSRQMAATAK